MAQRGNGEGRNRTIGAIAGNHDLGIRTHWLLRNQQTPLVMEKAGFNYDSTLGYNDTIGYLNGTSQVFRSLGTRTLFEVPLHIQDGSVFYSNKLNLSKAEAGRACRILIEHARKLGGLLTVLWHDRSHAPERFRGRFYCSLLLQLKADNPWFATAGQAVSWFRSVDPFDLFAPRRIRKMDSPYITRVTK